MGTPFAFCAESGLASDYKQTILASIASGTARVLTDPLASPTHFPFKIVQMEGSLSQGEVYSTRTRICDLGYLREAYRTPEGTISYRCAAEPVTTYVAKGGKLENTVGRKCLCNALLANVGLPQVRSGKGVENGLVTAGSGLAEIARFLPPAGWNYSAADVVNTLLGEHVVDSLSSDPMESTESAIGSGALMPA